MHTSNGFYNTAHSFSRNSTTPVKQAYPSVAQAMHGSSISKFIMITWRAVQVCCFLFCYILPFAVVIELQLYNLVQIGGPVYTVHPTMLTQDYLWNECCLFFTTILHYKAVLGHGLWDEFWHGLIINLKEFWKMTT